MLSVGEATAYGEGATATCSPNGQPKTSRETEGHPGTAAHAQGPVHAQDRAALFLLVSSVW